MVRLCYAIAGVALGAVDIADDDLVATLHDAILARHSNALKNVDSAMLRLFTTEKDGAWLQSGSEDVKKLVKGEKTAAIEELTHEDKTLDPIKPIRELFADIPAENTIHVLVVASNQVAKDKPSQSATPSLPQLQTGISNARSSRIHSETRRKRWRDLNEILDRNPNKKAKINGDGGWATGYSYVRWGQIKNVLDIEAYRQKRKPIPERKFKFLVKYLKYASKAMNGYSNTSTESMFIAPVLVMFCSLFEDLTLEVEETVGGNEVHANGHFEFVLTRGKTKICIVQAKKNDFQQGKAHALIGCEAVAGREGLFVVYGIVTDFLMWRLPLR